MISDHYMKEINTNFLTAVQEEYQDNIQQALREEVGMSILENETNGISIVTDARHGWRKNARQTDVPCLGHKTNKVIAYSIITKHDDRVSQRHERSGTEKIKEHFETCPDGPVSVAVHAHDRNLSVKKYIRENRPFTVNQSDTWHAGKSVEKEISKITKGPQYKHGITWHQQLSDKSSAIRTVCTLGYQKLQRRCDDFESKH